MKSRRPVNSNVGRFDVLDHTILFARLPATSRRNAIVNNQLEEFAMRHQRKSLSVIAVIAELSMNGWTVLGQKQNKVTHRSRATAHTSAWEYKVTGLLRDDELNKLGAEGWELVAIQSPDIDNLKLYFKRRKR
jgi:hypothetical protein